MRSGLKRGQHSYGIKLAVVAAVAVLGDSLFWQQGQWAGIQGLFGLGLIGAVR